MGTSKRIFWIAVAAIVLLCGLWWFHDRTQGEKPNHASDANEAPTAAVAVVREQPAVSSITVPGVFQAYQDIDVHAKVSGYVKKINVDIGDIVHTGEVLAVLEVPSCRRRCRRPGRPHSATWQM